MSPLFFFLTMLNFILCRENCAKELVHQTIKLPLTNMAVSSNPAPAGFVNAVRSLFCHVLIYVTFSPPANHLPS